MLQSEEEIRLLLMREALARGSSVEDALYEADTGMRFVLYGVRVTGPLPEAKRNADGSHSSEITRELNELRTRGVPA
jgi:hypothetical protein